MIQYNTVQGKTQYAIHSVFILVQTKQLKAFLLELGVEVAQLYMRVTIPGEA